MTSRISKFEDTSETQKAKYFAFFKTFFFVQMKKSFLPTNVLHHIETSHLILSANHLTGFYKMGNTDI